MDPPLPQSEPATTDPLSSAAASTAPGFMPGGLPPGMPPPAAPAAAQPAWQGQAPPPVQGQPAAQAPAQAAQRRSPLDWVSDWTKGLDISFQQAVRSLRPAQG